MHVIERKSMSKYRTEVKEGLEDKFLRKSLDKFFTDYRANRKKIFTDFDEKTVIEKIAISKDAAMSRLEELYLQFKEEAEKRGVTVHRAETAEDANAIVADIAKKNNVKHIAKSKSMTTEETQLNAYLIDRGYEVIETDLGEWIIQLRGEGPSHMVMPAIHLSRDQIADDFTKETGIEQDNDIQRLVKVARARLRKEFIVADMGISGANVAVAENGSIATVTNEGNARLVTTLPKIHVAFTGLDKLIPTLEEVLTTMLILPRNATAQLLTSYVSWICGATNSEITEDKTRQVHIIFLDNGRSKVAKDPIFSEVMRCVRCGACANVCPVYRLVGGHKMGYIYIGAVGLILTYLYHGHENAKVLAQNCINCDACRTVCASGIDLPKLIREVRVRLVQEYGSSVDRKLMKAVMGDRKMFHRLLKFASYAQLPITAGTKFQRHLPLMLFPSHNFRALPAIASKSFRDQWKKVQPKVVDKPKANIAIFSGCAQDFMYPEQLVAAMKIFEAKNVNVSFPMDQGCCALPLEMVGERETVKSVARRNIDAFVDGNYDAIITLCASCGSFLKNVYGEIFHDEPEYAKKAEVFSSKIQDFSFFARNTLGVSAKDFNKSDEKVTYHAACHECRGLEVIKEPRELISFAADYVPAAEEDTCCGFGGTYSVKFADISGSMVNRKIDNFEATGATRLVMDCPGCVIQLKGGAKKRKSKLNVGHIAELLAENLK